MLINSWSIWVHWFKLLRFFMTHQERAYSRGQLLDQVWGGNVYVEERTVDVHIRRLRKALKLMPWIMVVWYKQSELGYRFLLMVAQ